MLAVEILAFPYRRPCPSLCMRGSASDVDPLRGHMNPHTEVACDLAAVEIDIRENLIVVGHPGLMGDMSPHQRGGPCYQSGSDMVSVLL